MWSWSQASTKEAPKGKKNTVGSVPFATQRIVLTEQKLLLESFFVVSGMKQRIVRTYIDENISSVKSAKR